MKDERGKRKEERGKRKDEGWGLKGRRIEEEYACQNMEMQAAKGRLDKPENILHPSHSGIPRRGVGVL